MSAWRTVALVAAILLAVAVASFYATRSVSVPPPPETGAVEEWECGRLVDDLPIMCWLAP
ncbi:MAG TPA: hypothetical protein VGP44_00630 [Gemmatimonadales bacterium]|nr:hypothetical protein [Gemmatimonadales bacterium]